MSRHRFFFVSRVRSANAERMFFQDWAVPGFDEIPQTRPTYPCECLLMYQGLFKQTADTEGKPAFF